MKENDFLFFLILEIKEIFFLEIKKMIFLNSMVNKIIEKLFLIL